MTLRLPNSLPSAPAFAGLREPGRHWLTAERLRVYSWMIVAIFGAVAAVWVMLSLPRLVDPRGKPIGYDFLAYWSAAKLALAGHPASVFDDAALSAAQHAAIAFRPDISFPWHYPPPFLLAVLPLGLLPYPAALAAFVIGTAALYGALIRRTVPDPRFWTVAAATPAALINLLDGQNAFLTVALAGFALLWLDRRPWLAGVLVGLVALKPHLAVLFPLALLAEGRGRSLAAAALTAILMGAASLVVFGWDTYAAFFAHLPLTQGMADRGGVPWGTMPSAYVFALSLGTSLHAAAGLQVLVALFAALCAWRAWRRPGAPFETRAAVLLTGSLLVSPYLFYYDLLWAALAVCWLALLGLREGFGRVDREVLLLAWLAPVLMVPTQWATGVQIGFPVVLALLMLAIGKAAPLTAAERKQWHGAVGFLRDAPWLTAERVWVWGIGLTVMSAALLVWHVISHTEAGLTDWAGDHLARDFINYWGGRSGGEWPGPARI